MNPEVLILAAHPAYASRARPELSSLHFETRPFRTQPPGRFCQLRDTHTSSSISSEYTTPTGGGTSCKISCKGPSQHNDGTVNWCREAGDKQRPHMRYWLASRSWCLRGRRCLFGTISRPRLWVGDSTALGESAAERSAPQLRKHTSFTEELETR
jgi:hypothetical protein